MKHYGFRLCRGCGKLFELAERDDMRCPACVAEPAPASVAAPVTVKPVPATPLVTARPQPAPRAPKPPRVRAEPTPRVRGPRVTRMIAPPAARRHVTVNGTCVPGQRTLPMLRALAAAPAGLTTPDLAELIAASASSWTNALGIVRQLMLKQQRQGRVVRAGTVAGDRTRESALWRITEAGERYVRDADEPAA